MLGIIICPRATNLQSTEVVGTKYEVLYVHKCAMPTMLAMPVCHAKYVLRIYALYRVQKGHSNMA